MPLLTPLIAGEAEHLVEPRPDLILTEVARFASGVDDQLSLHAARLVPLLENAGNRPTSPASEG